MNRLSHLDAEGRAAMVDVSGKTETARSATARGLVTLRPDIVDLITAGGIAKGDVLTTARLAGIMAAKRTDQLIPLCHGLPVDFVGIDFVLDRAAGTITVTATARVTGRTGVEMEALTAVSVAALTIYDMCKAVDKGIVIGDIRLLAKSGGKSGEWVAP
ncbi:cyclic pyranopterin monophosphate synthase MoaC [Zavarzinia compransoris]|uniref:Cyclic pyranopterin monophosphate synthase n=1 Tax=Zavarzinia compransoris TaxID=1264899 RepID=A0A317EB79_9PROT|nr:cyclic pyranopterin monophosphate synthase MoaC [Zavarzinia compransoris]PWR23822.1 cyclic pyranopterin monophosphate synthase MoaC [Zavarzinia compransoris]TDP48055.1 cyclic pyranopterin monophosphate synthase subunit MoaC [Zavarzinia compransoris]